MKTKGRLENGLLRLDANHDDLVRYEDKELDVEVTVHREKRSLDANRYFHKLCRLIAEAIGSTEIEVKNQMISDWGQSDDDYDEVKLRLDIEWPTVENMHLHPLGYNDGKFAYYSVRRGSHTYNTKEMSFLIEHTVDEAKMLGIETLPPEEIKRMEAAWHQQGTDQGTKGARPRGN